MDTKGHQSNPFLTRKLMKRSKQFLGENVSGDVFAQEERVVKNLMDVTKLLI